MDFAAALADRLDARGQLSRWRTDPVAWATDRLGEHVWSGQAAIARSVDAHQRTAVQSAHGIGKSHIASRVICRFLDTREPGTASVVTSAPTTHQVRAILWRYIRHAHRAAGLAGSITQGQIPEWKIDGVLVGFGRKPADYDEAAFQGVHNLDLLIVLDEACGIPKQLWDAAESLMTNQGCRILAIGNPDDNSSFFHRVCTTEPGWNVIRISAYDTPNLTGEPVPPDLAARLVSREWVEDKRFRWGASSPLYLAKVLGEFADAEEGLIPLSWVRAAQARWEAWRERADASPVTVEPPGRRVLGVDVARFGDDKTAVATRQGDVVLDVQPYSQMDTTQTTAIVESKLAHPGSTSVVDVVGVGAGVVDQLRARGKRAVAFNGSAATKRRDTSGSWRFANARCAAWYSLRELLDPALGATIALPPDDDLTADLTAPRYEPRAGGILWVEDKASVRKRLGHSPDHGDAVVQAFWIEHIPVEQGEERRRPRPVAYADSVGGWG